METNANYRVFWTNFGYYSQEEFSTLAEALDYIRSKSFEGAVHKGGEVLAARSTFGGTRYFTEAR